MRSRKAVEKAIRTKLNHTLDLPLRDQLLARALREQEQSQETEPALNQPVTRRMIMKNPIVKLGIAAAIIAMAGLGIAEFLGTGKTSGVAWGEVAKKVEASRGLIYRERTLDSQGSDDDTYFMYYATPTHMRTDMHKGNDLIRSIYLDCATRELLLIHHADKVCWRHAADDQDVRGNERQLNLKDWVEEVLSREHTNLGRKTIGGIPCEGIETRYAAFGDTDSPPENHVSRVWVSVETGYPVLCEGETLGDDGQPLRKAVLDRFQWDVKLDASEFEPNIPAGYEQM